MKEIINKLKIIQKNLKIIFTILKIPFTKKIQSIIPLSEKIIEQNKQIILNKLNEILKNLQEIEPEELVQKTDFRNIIKKMAPIINELNNIIEKSLKNEYEKLYLIIQLYWFIEYFIKHEIEFKNNEFFNENLHYKWIIDDACLDFMEELEKKPNSPIEILNNVDKNRNEALLNSNLIEVSSYKVNLTPLGKVLVDLTIIGDIYFYYSDEFNELFEEVGEKRI